VHEGAQDARYASGWAFSCRKQLADKLTVAETLAVFRSFLSSIAHGERSAGASSSWKKAARAYRDVVGRAKAAPGVACALVSKPELLFLDEPTTASIRTRGGSSGDHSELPRRWRHRAAHDALHGKAERCATAWRSWITGK